MQSRRLLVVLGFLLVMPALARACNIPVFRYALERWKPDPFEVTVIHRGPLTLEDKVNVTGLRSFSFDHDAYANYYIETLNLHQLSAALIQGFSASMPTGLLDPNLSRALMFGNAVALGELPPADDDLPVLVVRAPDGKPDAGPMWVASLTPENTRALMTSPIRREIARRLLHGESAVWLLLECGDAEADEVALKTLQTQLPRLEKELKLPEGIGEPGSTLLLDLPLTIKFSILRVRRDDPAEQLLVHNLLTSEPDLKAEKFDRQPMVFPVFGRGRCLWGLLGKGINPDVIASTADYLVDRCSCEKKRANPGFEIVFGADWEALYDHRKIEDPVIPLLSDWPQMAGFVNASRIMELMSPSFASWSSLAYSFSIDAIDEIPPPTEILPGPPRETKHDGPDDDPQKLAGLSKPPGSSDGASSPGDTKAQDRPEGTLATAPSYLSRFAKVLIVFAGGLALLVVGSLIIIARSRAGGRH